MKTYLIQRASIEDRDYKKGIDSIIRLDYMGSSEFEFGAVPDSLRAIRASIPEYTYMDVPIGDKVITVFCKTTQHPDIKMYLRDLADDNIQLQERSEFNDYVCPSEIQKRWQAKHPLRTNFWWDLDNNLMFWVKNTEFEIKFKAIIEIKPN